MLHSYSKALKKFRILYPLTAYTLIFMCCYTQVLADTNLQTSPFKKEEEVKRIVLGIMGYTKWVPPPVPIQLCVVGSTKYTSLIEHLDTSQTLTKIVVTKQNNDINIISTQCDVIYFGDIAPNEQQKVIAARHNRPILLLSENNPTCEIGSSFCLNTENSPMTFTVNMDSLVRSGVHVNPNVLLLGSKKRNTQ